VSVSFRERAGVIVIRVWLEADAATGLRARITAAKDLTAEGEAAHEQPVAVAASINEVVAAVTEWLQEFVDSS
jgi:hypothetical protein